MTNQLLSLFVDESGIAVLTFADAKGSNSLSEELVSELTSQLANIAKNESIKVCIFRGLPSVFCSGGSKEMLMNLAQGVVTATDIMLSRSILELPIPTIANMQGHAVGGGLTLGLCCDVVLMCKTSRYGCSFMNMGFTPGMGTTRILELAFGPFVAAEMMYGGEFFRGSHFEGMGGVNYVLPAARMESKAYQIAQRIADKPRTSLELLKRSLSIKKRQIFEEARTSESFMHEISFKAPGIRERIAEFYEGGES